MMNAKTVKERLPYRLREQFLSSTEVALFSVLQEMADGHYIVCPKVALNDIFYIQRPNENVHFYNIRTGNKHRYALGYLHLNFISL